MDARSYGLQTTVLLSEGYYGLQTTVLLSDSLVDARSYGLQTTVLPHTWREYSYLKDIHITGYKAARGQLQFLLHIVQHAPALEALTVDTTQLLPEECFPDKVDSSFLHHVTRHARDHLSQELSSKVKLCVL